MDTRCRKTTTFLTTCRELDIGFVPYSPLGRGFLSGEIKKFEDLAEDDWRRLNPRFQGENFEQEFAARRKTRRNRGAEKRYGFAACARLGFCDKVDDLVPIPGTKRVKYLEQNAAATEINLSEDELEAIRRCFSERCGDRRALYRRNDENGECVILLAKMGIIVNELTIDAQGPEPVGLK